VAAHASGGTCVRKGVCVAAHASGRVCVDGGWVGVGADVRAGRLAGKSSVGGCRSFDILNVNVVSLS